MTFPARLFALLILVVGMAFAVLMPATQSHAETIYVDEANPPFMYRAGNEAAGIYPALIRTIFLHAGIDVDIVAVPWKRAIENLDANKGGVAGIYKNLERQKKYFFSDPIHVERLMFYQRQDAFSDPGDIDDLRGQTVGVIRGWSYGDEIDNARKRGVFTASEASGDEQNFQMLELGRVDTVIAIAEAGSVWVKRLKLDDTVTRSTEPVRENPTYIVFNRASPAISMMTAINRSIEELRENGTLQRITNEVLQGASNY
ncbi:substrate-binding periplasmic protein [Thalassospira australica]|uniref:substrate-binding periplasmic protein n=1 Tax=Thalassospira australica TaxID=1528106 RepID=UPI00384BC9E6